MIHDSLVSTDQLDSTILRFFDVGRSENRLLNRRGYERTHEKKEMYYSVLQGKYPSALLSTGVSQWPDFLQFAPHSVNCFYRKRVCFLLNIFALKLIGKSTEWGSVSSTLTVNKALKEMLQHFFQVTEFALTFHSYNLIGAINKKWHSVRNYTLIFHLLVNDRCVWRKNSRQFDWKTKTSLNTKT